MLTLLLHYSHLTMIKWAKNFLQITARNLLSATQHSKVGILVFSLLTRGL